MKLKIRKRIGIALLATTFIFMCVLRLWFTLLLILGGALIYTLVTGRTKYCAGACPMGTLQDLVYDDNAKPRRRGFFLFLKKRPVRIITALLFWGMIITAGILLRNQPNLLWAVNLRIMLGSALIALLLQMMTRKRAWCSTVCPMGNTMGLVRRKSKTG